MTRTVRLQYGIDWVQQHGCDPFDHTASASVDPDDLLRALEDAIAASPSRTARTGFRALIRVATGRDLAHGAVLEVAWEEDV